jgi:putative tryptophan/tyrosine transport system substrate-binding protein
MNRREILALLGGAATWPHVAYAQQPAMPVIGFLGSESPDLFADRVRAFRQGLRETGYVEGQSVTIEYRWAEGHYDRLPALAADLARHKAAVIATAGASFAALAAKAATTTIPIVFQVGSDPVSVGLVASLNRPGGNITGVTTLARELDLKRLELLHELVPTAATIALLVNPTNPSPSSDYEQILQAAARTFGLQLHVLHASTERDFDTVFATLVQMRGAGLVIASDPFFTSRREQLAALTVRYAVPTIYQYREFTAVGGLMSYGGSNTDQYRLVGLYTGRILKGEKPADLPVQQVTKVDLIINLKTAKTLGLTVPLALLTRADEVIE